MRWIVLCGLLVIVPGLARADDAERSGKNELELERLRLIRMAVEARLRLGDVLLEKGDREAAIREYRSVAQYIERKLGAPPAAAPRARDVPARNPWVASGWRKHDERLSLQERMKRLRSNGGNGSTELAVQGGLRWLAAHQDNDGRWDSDGFAKHDPAGDKCAGAGGKYFDVGVTSLALLAFLGAGHTDRGSRTDNPYAKNVRMGLRYLMSAQDEDGVFGTRATQFYMYNTALGTWALAEAYGMTKNPRYKEPLRRSAAFLQKARNPYLGWRYDVRGGDNDTSVTTVCAMALKAAEVAGIAVDKGNYTGALAWVEKMTNEHGSVGYNMRGGSSARTQGMQIRFPAELTESMTAAGLLIRRVIGGQSPLLPAVVRGAARCRKRAPRWAPGGHIDHYYWWLGTMAMFHVGGESWKVWNKALQAAVLPNQHAAGVGARTGSWDPVGPWGPDGGRIASTALMVIALETYYRYERAGKPS